MRNRLAAAILALPLFFCSPQTTQVPVAPAGSALVVATVDTPSANAAPIDPLLQQRLDATNEVMKTQLQRFSSGQTTIDELGLWSERQFAAQKDALKGKELSAAAQERINQWKKIEALAATRVSAGLAPSNETAKAAYFRASAEIDAAR